jgi:hypothetical protein
MSRGLLAASLGVLICSSLVLGQTPPPTASTGPIPSLSATWSPSPPAEAAPFDDNSPVAGSLIGTFDADYVLWTIPNHQRTVVAGTPGPPSTSTTTGTDTLGDEHLDRRIISGARFALGCWMTEASPWVPGGQVPYLGAETRFFFTGQRSVGFTDGQSGTLERPFLDLNNQQPSAAIVAAPGIASGTLSGTAKENMWGAEANLWKLLQFDGTSTVVCSLEGMVGLRYLDYHESIGLNQFSLFDNNLQALPQGAFLAGNTITEQESFATRNQFWGGQLGVRGRLYFENVIVSGQFQLALGDTDEQITIRGRQTRTLPGGLTFTSPGALLALPSNIGRFNREKFTQVPEISTNIAHSVTDYLTLSLGFSALYWSRLAKPADQVDRAIDITQIPNFPGAAAVPTGQQRPGVPFSQSNLWLIGTTINAELKF